MKKVPKRIERLFQMHVVVQTRSELKMSIQFSDVEITDELGKKVLAEWWKLKSGLIEVKGKWEKKY